MAREVLDYGCDLCGERHQWELVTWITSSCGVCEKCREKLTDDDIKKLEDEFE